MEKRIGSAVTGIASMERKLDLMHELLSTLVQGKQVKDSESPVLAPEKFNHDAVDVGIDIHAFRSQVTTPVYNLTNQNKACASATADLIEPLDNVSHGPDVRKDL
ncbi:hypothetical protein M758_UG291500 [Ceratodon purpureus]|nr:hypothetical protein M758_UG291500 [Ceratodon purpureus]